MDSGQQFDNGRMSLKTVNHTVSYVLKFTSILILPYVVPAYGTHTI